MSDADRLREIANTVCWGDGSVDEPLHPEELEHLLRIADSLDVLASGDYEIRVRPLIEVKP